MSFRSLVVLTVVFVVVGLGIWVAQLNQQQVELRLPGLEPMEAPLWAVCFLALLTGVFLALSYSLVLSSREAFDRWRTRRRERKAAEVSKVFRSAVDAALHRRYRKARALLEEVVEQDPEHLRAWLVAGDVERHLGDAAEAVEKHMRAQVLAPDDARVQEALAADFEALGEDARARQYLERRLESEPKDDPEPYGRLRDLLARQESWEEALEVQTRRLALLGRDEDREVEEAILRGIRFEVGRARLKAGRPGDAANTFEELLEENDTFVPAYLYLGEARLEGEGPEEALEVWRAGFRETDALGLLERISEHHMELERPERAIQTFHGAIGELDANAAVAARFLLGRLYFRLEMIEEAEAEFAAIEEDVEFTPIIEFYLAQLRQRRGDDAGAARMYREVVETACSLEAVYRCEACEAMHDSYTVRCRSCERWGVVEFDASQTFQVAEETPVELPPL